MSKPFEFGQTLLVFGALIGVCVWIGMIVAARGEDRLSAACLPIERSTDFVHQLTTAMIGQQPTWTLYLQQYMMSGCYYFYAGQGTDLLEFLRLAVSLIVDLQGAK